MKISIDDREIELETCAHCGAIPTEADAQAELKSDLRGPTCSICQQKVKLTEMRLTHHYYGGERRWSLDGKYDEIIEISHWSGANWVRGTLHVSCLRKVAPGIIVSAY